MGDPTIPTFATEAEDAAWHEAHREDLEEAVLRRIEQGTALTREQRAMRVERQALREVTLLLHPDDIEAARRLAADQGISHEAYLATLVHETLRPEGHQKEAI